ncbi:hypothetical protein [Phaffia rhodozyma]|uniref:Uncharacterized protein n=1 Tax=Phaffia rhodozyma TaxID=264483 RepID=A0A0F7SRC2_PHARH|nr:hypothetical protein [Phaffia rhodozyma]
MPSFMALLDRFETNVAKITEASSHPAAPAGPFSVSMSRPFPANVRDANPGERELFKYVGPKHTSTTAHAPPASANQTLFEVTSVQPVTPLRNRSANASSTVEPDVLLRAALKLVDGYQPMPRKREFIIQLMDQYELSRQTNEELDELLLDMPEPEPAPQDVGLDDLDTEPSIEDLFKEETARVKQLESKKMKLQKLKFAKEKRAQQAVEANRPSTPPAPKLLSSYQPRRTPIAKPFSSEVLKDQIGAPTTPRAAQWQTPTITRFLAASQKRTPKEVFVPSLLDNEEPVQSGLVKDAPPDQDSGDVTIEEEKDGKGDDDEDPTVFLRSHRKDEPLVNRVEKMEVERDLYDEDEQEADGEADVTINDKADEKIDEPLITMQMETILNKLWISFGDILRQSSLAPESGEPLPPRDTFDLLTSLAQLELPPPPISSSSIASSSTPAHPLTPQGVLLAHVFLALLEAEDHALPMSEIKSRLSLISGGEDQGIKAVYWGVGKRGLMIKRGGGEAKVAFA